MDRQTLTTVITREIEKQSAGHDRDPSHYDVEDIVDQIAFQAPSLSVQDLQRSDYWHIVAAHQR